MLVYFYKSFVLEGENTQEYSRHIWGKTVNQRRKIYAFRSARGICDESEVESSIEAKIQDCLENSPGWGKDFSGWQRVVPYDELPSIAESLDWDVHDLPTDKVTIEYIKDWPMDKILKTLNGKQFITFLVETAPCTYGLVGDALQVYQKED